MCHLDSIRLRMDAAKGREAFVEWRSGYGRVKMEWDYGNEGAKEGGREHVGDDE
jgi:hypothetical protein